MEDKRCKKILEDLHLSFQKENYHGWDLYDALLSKFFVKGSVLDSYYPRYIWTQVNKRAPINLRPLMRVPKSLNPKGLSLILRGYCELYKQSMNEMYLDSAKQVLEQMLNIRSNSPHYCWGNNFSYQSRSNYYIANTPNGITTSFVSNSIYDIYSITQEKRLLNILTSIKSYYLEEMLISNESNRAVFKYYINPKPITYNATAKATESLALINSLAPDSYCEEIIRNSYNFILSEQNTDGSWFYADDAKGQWIDNFHTGYVLVALNKIKGLLSLDYGQQEIDRGLDYHLRNHYTSDWLPKYYSNSMYPIDTHCYAQSIITFSEFGNAGMAKKLVESAVKNTYNHSQKYFIYSIRKHYTVKTNLLRWCNAYMFYALALYESIANN